jgi:hypothetical protein
VQGSVDAPIKGQAYRATLLLLFLNDRLEMVMLMWTFDSPMSRRQGSGALESELLANYADELRRESKVAPPETRQWLGMFLGLPRPQDATISLYPWQDTQGNTLAIVDAMGQPTLLLMYVSSKVAGTTPQAPPPSGY